MDNVKRNRKEIRVEADQKLLTKRLKTKKILMRKGRTPQKNSLKETANSIASQYHSQLAVAN